MLTATKINIIIIIIIIINHNDNNDNTKTTHTGLQIDAHENIDGQNNSVMKELMNSMLIIKRTRHPV